MAKVSVQKRHIILNGELLHINTLTERKHAKLQLQCAKVSSCMVWFGDTYETGTATDERFYAK